MPQEPRIQRQRSPLRPRPPGDAPVPEPVQVLDPPAAYVDAVEEPQQVAPVSPCRPEAEELVLRTPPRLDLIDPDVDPMAYDQKLDLVQSMLSLLLNK